MSKAIYLLRKNDMNIIKNILLNNFNFELCYEKKREMILKNEEVLISCKKKYIFIYFYDNMSNQNINSIIEYIS